MKAITIRSVFFSVALLLCASLAGAAPLKIGITWMGQSSMAERIQAAFTQTIQKRVPKVDIEFQHVKGLEDFDAITRIVRRYEKEKDGIVLLRSNGAKWLSQNPVSIPTFIGATNNPKAIGAVKNMDAPQGMITGVTYYLPHEVQFQIFEKLLPKMESVLLLLQKGHASTAVDRKGTRAACEKRGLAYHEKVCESEADSIDAVNGFKKKVSAIIIGTNSINLDNSQAIVAAAGKTPVLAYTDKAVKNGALAGYVPDDAKRGQLLAESVYQVLVEKKPIAQVPVKTDPDPRFLLNSQAAEKLGLTIPYSVLRHARILE